MPEPISQEKPTNQHSESRIISGGDNDSQQAEQQDKGAEPKHMQDEQLSSDRRNSLEKGKQQPLGYQNQKQRASKSGRSSQKSSKGGREKRNNYDQEQKQDGSKQDKSERSNNVDDSQMEQQSHVAHLKPLRAASSNLKRKYKIKADHNRHNKHEEQQQRDTTFNESSFHSKEQQEQLSSLPKVKSLMLKNGASAYGEEQQSTRKKLRNLLTNKDEFDGNNESIMRRKSGGNTNSRSETQLLQENNELKNKNSLLMRELKGISSKLDKAIQRKNPLYLSNNKIKNKPRISSLQSKNNFELNNAYKQCEIYRKEISQLKSKASFFNQQKIDALTEEVKRVKEEKNSLEQDNKQLVRMNKRYEKMLARVGDGDYLKMREEVQMLRKQLRKVKGMVKKQEQQSRLKELQKSNEKTRKKKESEQAIEEQRKAEAKEEKQINLLKIKSSRDDRMIRGLSLENKKSKQEKEEFRNQLEDKDKEIESLRKIITNLRKIVRKEKKTGDKNKSKSRIQEHNEHNEQMQPEVQQDKDELDKSNEENNESQSVCLPPGIRNGEQQRHQQSKQEVMSQKQEKEPQAKQQEQKQKSDIDVDERSNKDPSHQQPEKSEKNPHHQKSPADEIEQKISSPRETKKMTKKYPYKQQKGQSMESSYKWNHHTFSSKIKQIQVLPHPNGHVKQLNFRYEKGEPPKSSKALYKSFCCDQNSGQYIRQVIGGFKGGLLHYIEVKTNLGRTQTFCKSDERHSCDNFSFGSEDQANKQFIGAFFGQNASESVTRLGCLIEQLK